MSRGSRLSETVQILITEEALAHPNTPRRALAVKLQDMIAGMGQPVPEEDTLVKMISRARNKFEDTLDRPWSLAVSVDEHLPPSATMALLKAWRMTQALDEPFPTREARWLAYLSGVMCDTGALLYWANKYAAYEKSYKLLLGRFDSCDLDAALVMDPCVCSIASLLGNVMPIPAPGTPVGVMIRPQEVQDCERDAYFAAAVAELRALTAMSVDDAKADGIPVQMPNVAKELAPLKELKLPVECIWAYTHWLAALSKGPRWRKMQRHEILDMMKRLREWVSQLPSLQEQVVESLQKLIEQKKSIEFRDFPFRLEFVPVELVREAGFSAESPLNSPGNWRTMLEREEALEKNMHKLERHNRQSKEGSKEVKQ